MSIFVCCAVHQIPKPPYYGSPDTSSANMQFKKNTKHCMPLASLGFAGKQFSYTSAKICLNEYNSPPYTVWSISKAHGIQETPYITGEAGT